MFNLCTACRGSNIDLTSDTDAAETDFGTDFETNRDAPSLYLPNPLALSYHRRADDEDGDGDGDDEHDDVESVKSYENRPALNDPHFDDDFEDSLFREGGAGAAGGISQQRSELPSVRVRKSVFALCEFGE